MCVLRAHINFHFWKKNLSRIEKVMTTFSIFNKMFSKIENLICALRAYINRTQRIIELITLFNINMQLAY